MEKETSYKHSKNKNSSINVRITDSDYEKLGYYSEALDISMAEVMRIGMRMCFDAYRHRLDSRK